MAACGSGARPAAGAKGSVGGVPFFEAALAFEGAKPGRCFKLGHMGLGYYLDLSQTCLPEVRQQLPERWRETQLREEPLRVDRTTGAGLSLEHSEFGFVVTGVDEQPGQGVAVGEVVVAVEGRILAGLSAPQMQASFIKRRVDGARMAVASLQEVDYLSKRDPAILECWDAQHQRVFYFHKKTGQSAWSLEDLQASGAGSGAGSGAKAGASGADGSAPPIDLASFLHRGFAKAPAPPVKKKKRKEPENNPDKGKHESDLAREERARWADWNAGERGGYTEQFLAKYKNCTSYPIQEKTDKRMKGSVGPGQGMEYMARWTGSKNSFN